MMTRPKAERGAVLVISLIFLVVLLLVALPGMETSVMEERMAGNLRDRSVALAAAESATRDAETLVRALTRPGLLGWTNQNGLYGLNFIPANLNAAAWAAAQAGTPVEGTAADPVYIIEHVADVTNDQTLNMEGYGPRAGSTITAMFRITALGTGATANSTVVVQTHFARVI